MSLDLIPQQPQFIVSDASGKEIQVEVATATSLSSVFSTEQGVNAGIDIDRPQMELAKYAKLMEQMAGAYKESLINVINTASKKELLGEVQYTGLVAKYIPEENLEPLNRGLLQLTVPYLMALEFICKLSNDKDTPEDIRFSLHLMIEKVQVIALETPSGNYIISPKIFSATSMDAFFGEENSGKFQDVKSLVNATWEYFLTMTDVGAIDSLENIKNGNKIEIFLERITSIAQLADSKTSVGDVIDKLKRKKEYTEDERVRFIDLAIIFQAKYEADTGESISLNEWVYLVEDLANEFSDLARAGNGATVGLIRYINDGSANIINNRTSSPMIAAYYLELIYKNTTKKLSNSADEESEEQ